MKPLSDAERERAYAPIKKPEVILRQRLDVRYHVEDADLRERSRRFLEALAAVLEHGNYRPALEHYIRVTAKCSRCSASCQIYQATGEAKDLPCARSELLLSVYRRHFTVSGILRGRLLNDPGLTDAGVEKMAQAFYDCTACRRCYSSCPMGVDHALITHLGRYVLSEIGVSPRALAVSVREQLTGKSGNTSGIPAAAMQDGLEFLSEEMREEKGASIPFPIDREDATYLFLPAVSDFLMEAGTLMGNAAVFRATGDSWTVGTRYFDGINYGLFYSDHVLEEVLQKVRAEVERLRAARILIGECGHASRVAKQFYPTFCGGRGATPVVSILEYTHQAWKQGRLKLRANAVTDPVTYHDPCNLARSGWIVEQPRELLRAFCGNYVEMTPNRRDNICCGGGGGAVSIDENRPYRMLVGGRAKLEQIRATGAKYCVAPCANCKKQLRELLEEHGVDCQVVGLHELLYRAIVLE
jgi:Fe-S oxidoreductase